MNQRRPGFPARLPGSNGATSGSGMPKPVPLNPARVPPRLVPSPTGVGLDSSAVRERMVRRLVSERRLPYVKVGRHVRISAADVEALITDGRVEASRPLVTGGGWS